MCASVSCLIGFKLIGVVLKLRLKSAGPIQEAKIFLKSKFRLQQFRQFVEGVWCLLSPELLCI